MVINKLYWGSVFIGILIVFILYKYNKLELFTSSTTPGDSPVASPVASPVTPVAPPSTTPVTLPFTPPSTMPVAPVVAPQVAPPSTTPVASPSSLPLVNNGIAQYAKMASTVSTSTVYDIPQQNSIQIYINSFNIESIVSPNTTYNCNTNYWCDSINKNIKFFLNGDNIPLAITQYGFPTKNIRMQGPRSDSLVSATNNFVLGSFTVSFYMLINTLNFDTDAPISLFQMYAETPNSISLYMLESTNPNNIVIEAIIGDSSVNYSWEIPLTTFMANGSITIYSLVVNINYNDIQHSTISLYIGNMSPLTQNFTTRIPTTPIILGNTQLMINYNRQLDANILAFMYHSVALTSNDINTLYNYFQQQFIGIKDILANQQKADDAQNALQSQLDNVTTQLNSLKNQPIPQCIQSPAISPSQNIKHWQIKTDGSLSTANAKNLQCNPLDIPNLYNGHGPSIAPINKNTYTTITKTVTPN